jgi:hypothetical protein
MKSIIEIWNSLTTQQRMLVCFLAKRKESDILEEINNL